jgi:8-oxo-dGTP pyrophosphatase MutT (NUDIX family)
MHERWRELTAAFPRIAHTGAVLRRSAVGIVVVTAPDATPSFLLTRRAVGLRNHPGQYALPGGKVDPGESIEECVRREIGEELGLDLPADSIVGVLDDYATRSGFVMTPVVLWSGDEPAVLRPDTAEVAKVFVVPVADIGVEPTLERIPQSSAPVVRLPLIDTFVHAPTAAILCQFGQLAVHGRVTRVAHFEQPVFAWR